MSRFLLVSLNLDAILQETTIRRRRERLRVISDELSLEYTYGATLGRIEAQDSHKSKLGISALMWICHSKRPLRAGFRIVRPVKSGRHDQLVGLN